MKTVAILAPLVAAALSNAIPMSSRSDPSDTEVLNVALSLEHLEDAFYRQNLQRFSPHDFTGDGLPPFARGRFEQISEHEKTHVVFLTNALAAAGVPAVQPCVYNFPVQKPNDFVSIAAALETVGSSAYSGAAALIDNPAFVTAGAVILAMEARHSAFIQSAVKNQNPWSGSFETPLTINQAFTLASSFIVSCPASNPRLPITIFPALTVPADARPGQTVKLTFNAPASGPLFAAFLSGLDTTFVPLAADHSVQIPAHLFGTVYVIVTSDGTRVTDEHTVAGPALLMFPFDSQGRLL